MISSPADGCPDPWRDLPVCRAAEAGARELLREALTEPGLSAAVRRVEEVIGEYYWRADIQFGLVRPIPSLQPRIWPAAVEARQLDVPLAVVERSLWAAHVHLLDHLLHADTVGSPRLPGTVAASHSLVGEVAAFTYSCCEEIALSYTCGPLDDASALDAPPEQARLLMKALSGAPVEDCPPGPPRDCPPRDCPPRDCPPRDCPPRDCPPRDCPPGDHHAAAVIWAEHGSWLTTQDLVRFALTFAQAIGGTLPMVARNGLSEVWLWTRWHGKPRPGAITSAARQLTAPHGLRVSTGPITPGEDGFRRSLLGAQAAQRALGVSRGPWLCDYGDVAPVLLLTSDVEQARWFAQDVLGDLASDAPWPTTLRETLRLYLALGRSRQRVAAALYTNRNTVGYRVEKATRSLGRSLDDDALDVRLALEIARSLDLQT